MNQHGQNRPPPLAQWLAGLGLHPIDADIVLGDLDETYAHLCTTYSVREARRWYWSQVLRSVLGFVPRTFTWSFLMLKNYLKIAFRTFVKHKGYAFINIFGLAVGIACALLIMLFIESEVTYDRFHEKADRVHRAWVLEDYGENQQHFNTTTPVPLGATLQANYPEIQSITHVDTYNNLVQRGDIGFDERIHIVEENFFEVFDFDLLRGDAGTALSNPHNILLTETTAKRYFGDEDPMNQTLAVRLDSGMVDFTVTGVAADPPVASSIQFAFLVPYSLTQDMYSERLQQAWFNVVGETYVLLKEGVDAEALQAKFPVMVEQIFGDRLEPGQYNVGLQPLTDIYLNPDFPAGLQSTSDIAYSYILGSIAVLVLVIACINFISLSIGRSTTRALEVGVRKVMGAQRGQLMHQFWGETMLMTVLSVGVGLLLARLALPLFNDLAGKDLVLGFNGTLVLFLVALIALVGLIAGSYPALVLSAFRPSEVLKGTLTVGSNAGLMRRGLIVVQFGLSIFLIISTLVMAEQLRYMQTTNLGFNKEQVVVVQTSGSRQEGQRIADLYRNALEGESAVIQVASAAHDFGTGGWLMAGYNASDDTYKRFDMNLISPEFVETLGMEIVAGRNFSREITSDINEGILVNEALVATYGWDDPIGQRLPSTNFGQHEVIGVVKDFNYASLRSGINPVVMVMNFDAIFAGISDVNFFSSPVPEVFVRIQPDNLPTTMAMLEQKWREVAPDLGFEYSFLDQNVDNQYREEERLGQIVGLASLLAIFIACLGLFGLATLTVARRTKEIGIRKALGASAPSIVVLLSKDFTLLVILAFVLAAPVGYAFLNNWLADFAFRISIGAGTFVLAGVLALAIAYLTISYHSVKAARMAPVESLRYE